MHTPRLTIPWRFSLLTTLAGFASAISLYIWINTFAVLFGAHLVSSSTIILSLLMIMAYGSLLAGRLADRVTGRLLLTAVLSGIAGLFLAFHPLLFRLLAGLFLKINHAFHLEPFGTEILRLVFVIVFLAIPVASISAIFIFLIRHFIRHTGQSGRFMGSSLVAGCTGTIAGLLLVLFCTPGFGFRNLQITASAFFFLHSALNLLLNDLKHSKGHGTPTAILTHRVKTTALWFRKKKTVLETGAKLKRATLRVFAFQAFSTIAYLLICSRILVNYSAVKTVYFHTILIMVLLAGLSLGGMLYKFIAEKPVNSYLTLATYQIINGFSAILSYVVFYLFHQVLVNRALTSGSFGELLLIQVILCSTLLFLPAIFLGISLPLTGKLYPKHLQHTGKSFGHLARIGFLGMLTGFILTRFVLIPLTGLYYAYFILVLLIIISGIYLILRDSRLIRGFRLGYAILAIVSYFAIVSAFRTFHFSFSDPLTGATAQPERKIEGTSCTLTAAKNEDGTSKVWIDNRTCFASDPESLRAEQLTAFVPLVFHGAINSATVAGFGTGITSSVLEKGGVDSIHITETYPEIIRFSSDVFAEINDDILTSSRVNLTIEDVRIYLSRMPGTTDLILVGNACPDRLPYNYTSEFYRLCYEKLSERGIMCQVLPIEGITMSVLGSLIKACSGTFPEMSLWYLSPERFMLMASKSTPEYGFCQLSDLYLNLQRREDLASVGITSLESLLARKLIGNSELRYLSENTEANRDDKPVVQFSPINTLKTDEEVVKFMIGSETDYSNFIQSGSHCNIDSSVTIRKIKELNKELKLQMAAFTHIE